MNAPEKEARVSAAMLEKHDPSEDHAQASATTGAAQGAFAGLPQCAAITRKGRRCCHPLKGTPKAGRDPAQWAKENAGAGYCAQHDGGKGAAS